MGYTYRTGRRNVQGLTDLGKTLIRELVNCGMIIDIDHMSAYARADTLAICEQLDCPVVSGHTGFVGLSLGDKRHEGQLTDPEIERIRNLGGMVNVIVRQGSLAEIGTAEAAISLPHVCGNSANTFAQAYLYAINKTGNEPTGFGTDFNGYAGLPGPRFGPDACPGGRGPGDQPGEVTYPFVAAATGTTMDRSVIGEKTFDINNDGLAHIGMLPDFIADLEAQGVTGELLDPLLNSASGYVTLWGKAWGKADSTRIPGGGLTGFVTDFPDSGGVRVIYRGRDGHVWELYLPRSSVVWASADLTALAGGAPAAGELTGFVTDFPDSGGVRVIYRGRDGHVWELYLPRSSVVWASADLTALAGGAPAAGELTGFVTDFPDSGGVRVIYRGRDGHVWELYLPRSSVVWASADLTALAGGAPAAGELTGFVTDFPDSGGVRVIYRGRDGHVWELYLPRSSVVWASADLTALAGGAPAAGELTGFVTDFPDSGGVRVIYRGRDGHVWELYLPRSSVVWASADLTALAGGAPAAGELTGFVTDFPDSGGVRVIYRGRDGHVWELYLPRSSVVWASADLTALAGGAPAAGELTGFVTDFPDSGGVRVIYRGEDGHVWELYLPRSPVVWASADLTALAGG